MIDKEVSMPEILDPGVLLPNIVASIAKLDPDRAFLGEVGSDLTLTYGQAYLRARQWAAAWKSIGVAPGDRVLFLMPPCIEWFTAWIGLSQVRGVEVALNTDFHGSLLTASIGRGKSRTVLTVPELAAKLSPEVLSGTAVDTVVIVGRSEDVHHAIPARGIFTEDLLGEPLDDDVVRTVQPYDTSMLVLTSGTTGPSKYVSLPWGGIFAGSHNFPPDELSVDDVLYQALPVYHGAARFMIAAVVRGGGRVVFRSSMSVRDFWLDIEKHRCTVTFMPGSTASWFLSAQPSPEDASTPLRLVFMVPVPTVGAEFAKRFGLRIRTGWGGSETCIVATGFYNPDKPTASGRIRTDTFPYFDYRVIDQDGRDLDPNEAGEVIVRPQHPWGMFAEYFDAPAATAEVWHDGWYHTGDVLRVDEDGDVHFVDRLRDTIRRRGKNISSFEVEAATSKHPAVAEAAAVGIPEPGGEHELKIVVIRRLNVDLDESTLVAFLAEHLPRYMVPRYVEFVEDFPRTEATNRVRKAELRAAGISATTWDREAAHAASPHAHKVKPKV